MLQHSNTISLRLLPTLYLLLLGYIVAALLFWGFSLQKNSRRILFLEQQTLATETDSARAPDAYRAKMLAAERRKQSRTRQYLGEGATFLLFIIIGAAVVWHSGRRSLRLSRQQNNFMLAVTHELKSPLAAVKLNIQTLQRHQLSEVQRTTLLERAATEASRLDALCNNILLASQMEGQQYVPAHEDLDLSALVEDSVDNYAARYPQRFEADALTPGVRVQGDRVMLQLAISNLLENAAKYAPSHTPIAVSLERQGGKAVLIVADQGPGIPPAERGKVFDKFYRAGSEETRRTKGTGLGLYLARRIIRGHRGKVCVRANNPTGAVFEVSLPLR